MKKINPYEKMTQDDFDSILAEIIDKDNQKASSLLSIPGVYEILSEEYNNDVLETWIGRQGGN